MTIALFLVGLAAAPQVAPVDSDCPPAHAAMGHCIPRPTAAAPAPPAPAPDAADRIWGREAMAPARAAMRREHGGMRLAMVMLDIAELRPQRGAEDYRWDGSAWFGGDVDRLVLKSEGEGRFGTPIDRAEVQALYSHAIGPYFNLQAGVRHDFAPDPSRTFLALGLEGLAPYWFDVAGTVFVSDRGDIRARAEGYYDQRITQRLILQPRAELNLGRGDGVELGLRLRYEIAREFAPYVGVSWERSFGGSDRGAPGAVVGIRTWF